MWLLALETRYHSWLRISINIAINKYNGVLAVLDLASLDFFI